MPAEGDRAARGRAMNELRKLADRAWRNGNYHAGVALDRAADLLDEAERLREQVQAHRTAATARLDQLQAHVRDITNPLQGRPMTALTARNVHLADQILAFLADQAPLPASTPAIHTALQPPCDGWPHTACRGRHVDYMAVYRTLNRLARGGDIEKWPPSDDRRTCLWRRLTVPVQP
jgi:hypothetical protein